MRVVGWLSNNKLVFLLLLLIVYLLFFKNQQLETRSSLILPTAGALPNVMTKSVSAPDSYVQEASPVNDVNNRMVITENTLSLQVKNVAQSLSEIKNTASDLGGYLVESTLDRPEEAASGNITVRVPQLKVEEALSSFKSLAVKVVMENLHGSDVTDQYMDNDERLKILLSNKARFEEIMARGVNVEEILRVQEQIFNLQNQIDSIKGQQKYLEKNVQMTKITVYLATDELALPFSPDQSWRPEAVFKQAVRNLMLTLRSAVNVLIWVIVYSVVWLPILLTVLFIKRKLHK